MRRLTDGVARAWARGVADSIARTTPRFQPPMPRRWLARTLASLAALPLAGLVLLLALRELLR